MGKLNKPAKLLIAVFLCACCFAACVGSCGSAIPGGNPIFVIKYIVAFDS